MNIDTTPVLSYHIYVLQDPRTQAVRYVGRSKNPRLRAAVHTCRPCNTQIAAWIAELRDLDMRPTVSIIRTVHRLDTAEKVEQEEIARHVGEGCDLLNIRFNAEHKRRTAKPKRVKRVFAVLPETDAWIKAHLGEGELTGMVVDRFVGIEIRREEQVRRFESALPPELSLEDLTGEA